MTDHEPPAASDWPVPGVLPTLEQAARGTATAIAGTAEPRPETTGDAIGVLGLLASGGGIGASVGGEAGGVAGAAIGGVAGAAVAAGALRWRPGRDATFRLVRSLTGD